MLMYKKIAISRGQNLVATSNFIQRNLLIVKQNSVPVPLKILLP